MTALASLPDPLPIEPLPRPLGDIVVELPGSKSITNRALVCAALADGPSVLTGVLDSDDTNAMVAALEGLGVDLRVDGSTATVWGCRGRIPRSATVDARMSGTTARFLLPIAALAEGSVTIDAAPTMRARPMRDGIEAVRALGRRVEAADGAALPITVAPDPDIDGFAGAVSVGGEVSSQFLSGLLMVAPCLPDGLEITVDGALQSEPYVEMTLAVMRAFGALVDTDVAAGGGGRWYSVRPTGYQHRQYAIEPDASAASYFLAAAALCGGSVTVPGLGSASLQGDVDFAEVLRNFGAHVDVAAHSITVTGGRLLGGAFDMAAISDTAQTLAAIAPFAESPTTITGIGFIRHKETDRIGAVVRELGRLGIAASELDDGLRIEPGPVSPGVVETYEDHRMAMSFAILGLRAQGVAIADPGCVSKTFPGFWETLARMRASAAQGAR